MKMLDDYFELQNKIYSYFGYAEDWRVIPLNDARDYYWFVTDSHVYYAEASSSDEAIAILKSSEGNYYSDEIYTQRHLPKWVYEGDEYTMICVDTHTDGNQFLSVFTNSKKIPVIDMDDYE